MYPVFVVGSDCKGCVLERESVWRLKQVKPEDFSRVSRDWASYEVKHVPYTWLECEESVQMETAVSRKYLTSKAFPRDTHETFCSISLYCLLIMYTHITHKWERELLRENPS